MRLHSTACRACLLAIYSSCTFLNCQKPTGTEQSKQLAVVNASSRKAETPPRITRGIPASPLAKPPLPRASGQVQPQSMFDAIETRLTGPVSHIEVHGVERDLGDDEPFAAGGQEILSTAGSYGDVERFLQVLPGVVATSDFSNEVLVRGGDPMENLFVVDGIEVPNINQVATSGTTGGFGPMIDSAVIQGIKFHTGGYDAHYPERLSSVIEIETLDPRSVSSHAEADVGIQGMGGLFESKTYGGDLLVSAHKGILQIMNSAGIGGLPSYENELIRFRKSSPDGDRFTILHIAGMDSVDEVPCPTDRFSFSTMDSKYSGWRETTGLEWQHIFSTRSFGIANVSDSEQIEHANQLDQLPDPTNPPSYSGGCPNPTPAVPPAQVYSQNSNEAFSTAGYRFEWSGRHLSASAGSAFWLQRPHYRVAQPLGAYSSYSVAPVRADSTSFVSDFSTGQSGSFAQLTLRPFNGLTLSAGGRLQTFAMGNHSTLNPRASVRFDPSEHVGLHFAYAAYAQIPPYVYLLSYPQNRGMLPMRVTHEIAGMDLSPGFGSEIHIEAYNKIYRNIPASTEYPAVNLHNLIDMIGEQIVWLPMSSGGRGHASGIELSDITRLGSRLLIRGSLAYSRAMFSGLDGVKRASNYDLPWIANVATVERFGRGYELSSRFGYATGRPYTPFDIPNSTLQNRPIYDLSKMNARRAPYYARLDVQVNKDFMMHGLHMELYMGANNVLNRKNFLSYVWLPDVAIAGCESPDSNCFTAPVYELRQTPIFPNFGLRYIFR